jgi:transposase-like protein
MTISLYCKGMETPKTLLEAIKFFSEYENCRQYMIAIRWQDGIVRCPNCGSDNVLYMEKARLYFCRMKHAKAKFSLKVGTIFEDSPIGLDKWLPASWLISNCKNGISSYELARALGVTQKSAWHMLHRLRVAMTEAGESLSGTIEMDETFVGGKAKNMHKADRIRKISQPNKGKTLVVGMLERGGKVKAGVVDDRSREVLHDVIQNHVAAGSTLITDELNAYKGTGLNHEIVNHAMEYVRGHIHTNGIESFWSMLKRTLGGTYISVEPFHLDAYVAEQVFRYNNRKDADDYTRFATCIGGIVGKRLTYAALTQRMTSVN